MPDTIPSTEAPHRAAQHPLDIGGIVSFWDFQKAQKGGFRAEGPGDYLLRWRPSAPKRHHEGVFGPAIVFRPGLWLECPRLQCPLLNFSGAHSQVTVVTWIKWTRAPRCQFLAGMWDETNAARQYGLFLNLSGRYESEHNVHAHVSADGGPTRGDPCCLTYATGAQTLELHRWYTLAMVFDGHAAKVYVDGRLDANPRVDERWGTLNPFQYPYPLYEGGREGADFTVGSVDSGGRMNNWFHGAMGGLAVYGRALPEEALRALHRLPAGADDGPCKVRPSAQ